MFWEVLHHECLAALLVKPAILGLKLTYGFRLFVAMVYQLRLPQGLPYGPTLEFTVSKPHFLDSKTRNPGF